MVKVINMPDHIRVKLAALFFRCRHKYISDSFIILLKIFGMYNKKHIINLYPVTVL